jgi:2-polyprenyl-6-hydroxyphenyl methylase/3-demethylubiquinone-9 3-methyltransferase
MNDKNFFGKNWQVFVKKHLNHERVEKAKESLIEFFQGNPVEGKSFLDIGCGSGLFSLAAYRLGASKVFSFDFDGLAVKCCEYLREREGNPENWTVKEGSILDDEFVKGLGKFDIVYCWGVLHHTGNMWKAMENTFSLVRENGLLYLAIYNRADSPGFYSDGRFGSSKFWLRIKRFYSHMPWVIQSFIDYTSIVVLFIIYLITFKNPFKKFKAYTSDPRGMPFMIIIKDWLGGYPYEFASVDEIFRFAKGHGFTLENIRTNTGLLNNEYLFKKG